MDPAVAKRGYQLSEEDLNALVVYLAASSHPDRVTPERCVLAAGYGTVFNTVAPGTDLKGVLVRAK